MPRVREISAAERDTRMTPLPPSRLSPVSRGRGREVYGVKGNAPLTPEQRRHIIDAVSRKYGGWVAADLELFGA